MMNHYNEFDDFMSYFNDARKYALENAARFENIKSNGTDAGKNYLAQNTYRVHDDIETEATKIILDGDENLIKIVMKTDNK